MNTQYFVNHKTRLCRMLGGHPGNEEHQANVAKALKDGFVEVAGVDEFEAFRAETQKARDAGWNPNGRTSYAKFMERQPEQKRMVAVPVATLTGQALAYAVAVAEGLGDQLSWCFREDGSFGNIWTDHHGSYCPDEDWEIGGPLLTKHAIGFVGKDADNWLAFSSPADEEHQGVGPTHLIAACRMIARAQLGDTVQVPEELTRG